MTPLEHAMVGINGALALGLHRRHGWKIVAMAGCAAASPDWDGLTLAAGPVLYDQAHRVWGHNVFACLLIGGACGLLDYQFDIVTRVGRRLLKLVRLEVPEGELSPRARRDAHGAAVWAITAVVVALSHLVGDLLVSGSSAYADWGVQILWPLTDRAWVYPRVPWGDVGITLVFVAGAALMLWRPQRVRHFAAMSLIAVAAYIAVRPLLG